MIVISDAIWYASKLIVGKGNKLKRFWLTDGFRDVLKNRIVCNVDAFEWSIYIRNLF